MRASACVHAPGSPISLEKKVRSAEILHPPASFTRSRGIPKRKHSPHRLASQVEIRSNGVRLEAPSSVHFSPGRTQRAAPQRAARRCSLRAIPGPGCSQPPPQPLPLPSLYPACPPKQASHPPAAADTATSRTRTVTATTACPTACWASAKRYPKLRRRAPPFLSPSPIFPSSTLSA